MDDRKTILHEIEDIERELKELEILYEQYLAGVEKSQPMKQREAMATRLRRFLPRFVSRLFADARYLDTQDLLASYNFV